MWEWNGQTWVAIAALSAVDRIAVRSSRALLSWSQTNENYQKTRVLHEEKERNIARIFVEKKKIVMRKVKVGDE